MGYIRVGHRMSAVNPSHKKTCTRTQGMSVSQHSRGMGSIRHMAPAAPDFGCSLATLGVRVLQRLEVLCRINKGPASALQTPRIPDPCKKKLQVLVYHGCVASSSPWGFWRFGGGGGDHNETPAAFLDALTNHRKGVSLSEVAIKTAAMCIGLQRPDRNSQLAHNAKMPSRRAPYASSSR